MALPLSASFLRVARIQAMRFPCIPIFVDEPYLMRAQYLRPRLPPLRILFIFKHGENVDLDNFEQGGYCAITERFEYRVECRDRVFVLNPPSIADPCTSQEWQLTIF